MPRPIQHTVAGPGSSPVIPLDYMRPNYQASIFVDVTSGSPTWTIEVTGDDVQASGYDSATGLWQNHSALAGLTSSEKGHLDFPARALRLTLSGAGEARLTVIEGGSVGGRR